MAGTEGACPAARVALGIQALGFGVAILDGMTKGEAVFAPQVFLIAGGQQFPTRPRPRGCKRGSETVELADEVLWGCKLHGLLAHHFPMSHHSLETIVSKLVL